MKKKRFWYYFNIILLLLTLTFIWTRSLKPIPASEEESMAFLRWIEPFLERIVGEGNVTNHLVRKLAHFCEYGLLGVEMGCLFLQRAKKRFGVPLMLLFGFLCGAIDENIQYFTGRGNRFSDVLLDFSGYLAGALGILLLARIGRSWKKNRKTHNA